jgi:3-dehydroquinate synthetase
MLPMCAPGIRARVRAAIGKAGLPVIWKYDVEKIYKAVLHDKKLDGDKIALIMCDKIGTYRINKIPVKEFYDMLKSAFQ